MKRAALYVRVSTQEQKKGLSVDNQIESLKEFCKDNNCKIVGIYNDAGISARKRYTKRPQLLQLLEDCKKNRIDVILFTRLDRWFRSVGDYYEVQRVLDECKVPWRAIWEDYETETSSGVFKVNIMLSVAQSEADRTSDRVKSVMQYKRAKGDYLGRPPFGYTNRDGKIVKDEEEGKIVEFIFQEFPKSRNFNQVMRDMHTRFGKLITRPTITKVLTSRVYCGEPVQGISLDPYISPEEFERIRWIKQTAKHTHFTSNSDKYYFSGMVKCGICGHSMYASLSHNKYGNKYAHYQCRYHQRMEGHPSTDTSQIVIEKYLLDSLEPLLRDFNARTYEVTANDSYHENEANKKRLQAKLKRIGVRFEEGDISEDEYKEKRSEVLNQIAELEMIAPIRKEPIELPNKWRDIYNELDDKHRRMFWSQIISTIKLFPSTEAQRIKVDFL